MIIGIGIDIIEISRIKKAMENKRFLDRNFTERELKLFDSKNFKAETVSGNFAAKEAISKALGTGFRGFNLIDIEILRDDLGSPYVKLYNNIELLSLEKNISDIKISISHSKEYAVANCIILGG